MPKGKFTKFVLLRPSRSANGGHVVVSGLHDTPGEALQYTEDATDIAGTVTWEQDVEDEELVVDCTPPSSPSPPSLKAIDWSQPVETTDGSPANRVAILHGRLFRHLVVYHREKADWLLQVNDYGQSGEGRGIRNKQQHHEGWVNIYRENNKYSVGYIIHETPLEAKKAGKSSRHYVTSVQVRFTT